MIPIPVPGGMRALFALTAAGLLAAGCGSSDGGGPAAAAGPASARAALAIALPEAPREFDPLLAAARADQLADRQIYEPLVERLAGPYGDVRRLPGLALSASPSADRTEWRLRLRTGVRFQDGALFNASAVLANARRWQTTGAGRALLPGLLAVDAPRPDLARLFFERPVPELRRLLASPRLGIVSPRALRPRSGEGAALARLMGAGTGPFELRLHTGAEVLVARNVQWWGTRKQLGPALDQVEFRAVADASDRLSLLRRGDVQVADQLGPAQVAGLRRDPLLTELAGPGGTALGLERSVRGFDSATEIPLLSQAWLTRIGAG